MSYRPRKMHPDFPYHLTGRANNRERFPLPLEESWHLFSDYLHLISKLYEIRIHSFVLMPNHFHLIARDPAGNLAPAMNYFMRETSRQMAQDARIINRVWGAPFGSSLIGSPLYYLHAYRYVYQNPVRARLCASPFDYRFSTLRALVGFERTIIPLEHDDTLFENFESAVTWLDGPQLNHEANATRLALRRKEFRFPRDESTKKPIRLELADSVPLSMRERIPESKGLSEKKGPTLR